MRVLIVGAGGREHALAWKVARDPGVTSVLVAPGSAGIAQVAECVPVAADDVEGLASLAAERGVDLTIVGPEGPLACGIVDRFEREGLRIFGPCRAAARLEASKAFMKTILVEARVPTARHAEFTTSEPALRFAAELGYPVVVKADGLAAGKGVVICEDAASTREAVVAMLEQRRFGDAGGRIVVEEFLTGEEVSFLALTDGENVIPLAPCSGPQDGASTAIAGPTPAGWAPTRPRRRSTVRCRSISSRSCSFRRSARFAARGIRFRGVLYAGLMMTRCRTEGSRVQRALRRSGVSAAHDAARLEPRRSRRRLRRRARAEREARVELPIRRCAWCSPPKAIPASIAAAT